MGWNVPVNRTVVQAAQLCKPPGLITLRPDYTDAAKRSIFT